MTARLAVPLVTLIVALAAGCGPAVVPASSPIATIAASLTPVPGGPSTASSAAATVTQTDTTTEVGRIWDALPPSFPRIDGAVPVETGGGPTSGTFAVGTDVASAVATIRAGLTSLGYIVDVGSALEDGTVVLHAGGGEDPECRIEVRFTPLSGTVNMSVLYGAACPFT